MTRRLAIVYPGDADTHRNATRQSSRFAALFAAFAAGGVDAVREQLLATLRALTERLA